MIKEKNKFLKMDNNPLTPTLMNSTVKLSE